MPACYRYELSLECDFAPKDGCDGTGSMTVHLFDNMDCKGRATKASLLRAAKSAGWIIQPDGRCKCPLCAKRK